jgi:outer membrane scaffolding protein for murein synthesis (MipA/OmpV family)
MGIEMRLAAAAVAAVTGLACAPVASFAADLTAEQPAAIQPPAPAEKGHWGFKVGAIGLMEPKYEGSDEYRFLAFPIVIPE